jgi:hypothetical protein
MDIDVVYIKIGGSIVLQLCYLYFTYAAFQSFAARATPASIAPISPERPSMLPSAVTDVKAFVPSEDFELSKQFYLDLGFTLAWSNNDTAELRVGDFGFLLQRFYVKEHAGNFMMHLGVVSCDPWWAHIERIGLEKNYPGIMARGPAMQAWGLRVLYLSDPSGVLWHIAELKPRK